MNLALVFHNISCDIIDIRTKMQQILIKRILAIKTHYTVVAKYYEIFISEIYWNLVKLDKAFEMF